MTGNEQHQAHGRAGAFVTKSQLMSGDDVQRVIRRMAHEIIERNHASDSITVIGLQTGGVSFANALAETLEAIGGASVRRGTLDVSFYRDDLVRNPAPTPTTTAIDHDLTDRTVVLVDDVLFTGRTIRAALNALSDWGRPRAVQLAVMVDRGHRELPIRPDFVGKNVPTSVHEEVRATLEGVWLGTREAT